LILTPRHPVRLLARLVLACALVNLTACGFLQREPTPVQTIPVPAGGGGAVPAPGSEGLARYGNPEFYDVMGKRYYPMKSARGYREQGIASWYGPDFHGKLTSTRETYDMYQMTGAHKLLPLPTWVEVTNLENGRKATLRVNDRGPFKDDRIIDLSYAAALALDVVKPGTARVEVRAIDSPADQAGTPGEVLQEPLAKMFVQVGAFGTLENAERLKSRLNPVFGAEVRILVDPPEGAQVYKVQLGPIRDVQHADRTVATLQSLGIAGHHFVND
jgi:rare lipoprotein A